MYYLDTIKKSAKNKTITKEQKGQMMSKKNKQKILVAKISSVEATLANKPHYVPKFRCGAHMTTKDRPRDKNWRRWI